MHRKTNGFWRLYGNNGDASCLCGCIYDGHVRATPECFRFSAASQELRMTTTSDV
jgi:hypothetical protein